MVKFRKSRSSDVHVGGAAGKSKKRSGTNKWALLLAVVVVGGLGSLFLYASHADELYKNVAAYSNQYCPNAGVQCTTYQMGITRVLSTAQKDGSAEYYAWAELEPGKNQTTQTATVLRTEVMRLDFGVPGKSFTATTAVNNGTSTVAASTGSGVITQADLPSMGARLTLGVRYHDPTKPAGSQDNTVLTYTTGLLKYTQFSATPVTATTPPPNHSIAFTITAPTPVPAPKPSPTPPPTSSSSGSTKTSSSSSSSTAKSLTDIVSIGNQNNDGCGGNASHYNGTIHVGQSHYGNGSVCICANSTKAIPYTKGIPDSQLNIGCKATSGASGGNGGAQNTFGGSSGVKVISLNQGNDGCGANAMHYNAGRHVGQTNYGSGSVCKCNISHKLVAYSKPYNDSTPNPGCNGGKGGGAGGSGSAGSGRDAKTCVGEGGRVITETNVCLLSAGNNSGTPIVTEDCGAPVQNHPNDCYVQ